MPNYVRIYEEDKARITRSFPVRNIQHCKYNETTWKYMWVFKEKKKEIRMNESEPAEKPPSNCVGKLSENFGDFWAKFTGSLHTKRRRKDETIVRSKIQVKSFFQDRAFAIWDGFFSGGLVYFFAYASLLYNYNHKINHGERRAPPKTVNIP